MNALILLIVIQTGVIFYLLFVVAACKATISHLISPRSFPKSELEQR